MWNFNSDKPIYCQLIEQFRLKILSGEYPPGSKVASVRELAHEACVNPNTVQKAYRLMEEEGYVVTEGNRPSTIRLTPELRAQIEEELCTGLVRHFIAEARRNRISYKRAIELLSREWDE